MREPNDVSAGDVAGRFSTLDKILSPAGRVEEKFEEFDAAAPIKSFTSLAEIPGLGFAVSGGASSMGASAEGSSS